MKSITAPSRQTNDYECFIDVGIYNLDPFPEGYKKIQIHLVYDA
jgi:hypothetical protein